MSEVRQGRIGSVVCVKMDRLGRSLPHLAQIISEFDHYGVALICTSQGIDTSADNPAGRLQMHVLTGQARCPCKFPNERGKPAEG
jgi:DNA invertase Pin-like site-specific DNA recombinase